MPKFVPFAGADRRTIWLRVILLGGCFFGMIASLPLWTNGHDFPLVPVAHWFPILHPPVDQFLLVLMLLALVGAIWFYESAVKVFLAASLFAFCEDQNRGQPWFYMYWVMLALTLLPDAVAIAACRWAMSVAYIWSGIQKFNAGFFHKIPAWFVAPAANWHVPALGMDVLRWSVDCTPFIELGIGLALWQSRLRPAAIVATVLVHGAALLFLGPLGYNYNWVVWPWNLAMIGLVCALFLKPDSRSVVGVGNTGTKESLKAEHPASATTAASVKAGDAKAARPTPANAATKRRESRSPVAMDVFGLGQTFSLLRRSKMGLAILALYSLLPILSYAGWWDSYFSFSLYAESSATANIFVTQEFGDRLPEKMKAQVKPFSQNFDPQFQGPCVFNFGAWCYQELHVPPMPEPRAYRAIFTALRAYSREPGDLRMIVGQRAGPVIFYEGDSHQFLTAK